MNDLSGVDLGWVAGIIEGEGHFGIITPRRPSGGHPQIRVAMTDRDVIDRLSFVVGAGRIVVKERTDGKKTVHTWALSRKAQVAHLLRQVVPLLGARRAARAQELLTLCSTMYGKPVGRVNERDYTPLVAFEPCAQYRIPVEGDLLTCATCGWWIAEHEVSE